MSQNKPPVPPVEPGTAAYSGAGVEAESRIEGSQTTPLEGGWPSPAVSSTVIPPELLRHPRYRVLALLGEGGMGAVYKARHTHMDRLVALKVIRPSLVNDPASLQRFQQEVRAAARLTHPNIVTAHDADQAGNLHFLVMEFVEGQSLADYLRRRGPLPVAEACSYARQTALGLQHAHGKNMVHRDVKPHNLMLTPQGEIKILDFGLARLSHADRAEASLPAAPTPNPPSMAEAIGQLTAVGAMMGTVDYMAPEQAIDAHAADIRADIYSLGCTLYQLLTGRVVFPGGSLADKLVRHQKAKPAPLSHSRPDVPQGLVLVLQRMLAKEPSQRYQTPAEVATALAAFAEGGAPLALPVARVAEQGSEASVFAGIAEDTEAATQLANPSDSVRRSWWVAGALTLLLAGTIAAVSWVSRRDPGSPKGGERSVPSANGVNPAGAGLAVPVLDHAGEVALLGHTEAINGVAVGGGRLAISGGFDRIPRLWDLSTGGLIKALEAHPEVIWCVALSPDGRYAASGGQHKAMEGRDPLNHDVLRLWDVASGRLIRKLPGHQGVVHHVAFTSDSRQLVSSSWDCSVRVWDVAGRLAPRALVLNAPCLATAFLPGDKELVVGTFNGPIRVLDLNTGKERSRFNGPGEEYLAVSPEGRFVLACRGSGPDGKANRSNVLFHDLQTGRQRQWQGHTDSVFSVAFAPDGRRAVTAGKDRTVRLWDVASARELYCDREHKGEVRSAVFTPDGRYILSAGHDGALRLWPLPPALRQ